jgi:hypothetical protein
MKEKCDLLNALIQAAESLVPGDADRRMEYWHRELGKTWSFLMEHEDHYMAFIRGKDVPGKVDPGGADRRTGHLADSGLRDMIVARVGYIEYAQGRLTELRSRRQNSFFLRA